MRVGTDAKKFPGSKDLGACGMLRQAHALGFDGVFFRSAFDLSATLDPGELGEVAATAADLGLYLQAGTGKINPFASPETPEIRAAGEGDFIAGMTRIIGALTAVGVREIWAATANYQFHIPGMLACDRFRTDAPWADQLAATAKVLSMLVPILRDLGAHLNLETHEEISSFEVVRLVEEAGPDVFGITFDVANVVVRGENPMAAARRVAPYARQSHVRDVALARTDYGHGRFLAPVGEGLVDWPALLRALREGNPELTLSVEGVLADRAEMPVYASVPRWRQAHPDLTDQELESLLGLSADYDAAAARGQRPDLAQLRTTFGPDYALSFITRSVAALRRELEALDLPTPQE